MALVIVTTVPLDHCVTCSSELAGEPGPPVCRACIWGRGMYETPNEKLEPLLPLLRSRLFPSRSIVVVQVRTALQVAGAFR